MTRQAIVVSLDDEKIAVSPLQKGGCMGCGGECSHSCPTFNVENPRELPLEIGTVVTLEAPPFSQAIQGIISLLFPIAAAIAGFFSAPFAASLFGKTAGDGTKALMVLLGLLISTALVFFVTRKFPLPGVPQIVDIYSPKEIP
ncbi:MAG TPA: hypothetical protein DEO40_04525 [Treponema sp.]|jgi:hypothetical protein|nr:SoxR reducing system RseC family protein [Treponema sp.]HAK68387.1 hypothetical protein [Treponema sp.]HBB43357.1 hypothetical protein [Treponema sp.]HCA19919.1 hypothetical protein [Treponema sp.]